MLTIAKKPETTKGSRKPKTKLAHDKPSTASTPSAKTSAVEVVEGVEGESKKPRYVWIMEDGLDRNFRQLGKLLESLNHQLYRHPRWRIAVD